MMEEEQYNPWMNAAIGYIGHPLAAYEERSGPSIPSTPVSQRIDGGDAPSGFQGRSSAMRRRRDGGLHHARHGGPRRSGRRPGRGCGARRSAPSATTRSDRVSPAGSGTPAPLGGGRAETGEPARPAPVRSSAARLPPGSWFEAKDVVAKTGMSMLERVNNNANALGLLFMLPAAAILLVFLTYPLGLGVWLGLTDTKIGRGGEFIGLDNFESLAFDDSVFWLSVFNTIFYTGVAARFKFVLGLWLALLLNQNIRFKSFIARSLHALDRADPRSRPFAFWWIYDSQFSIISWVLVEMGLIDQHQLPGDRGWNALVADRANIWRGIPFVAISLLAGCRPSRLVYEAATIDGASRWQRSATSPSAADAHHRDRDDLLGPVHVHRLPAHLRDHARRARSTPHLMATLVPARDPGGQLAEGARSPWRWCRS